jgi:hypothetical protein
MKRLFVLRFALLLVGLFFISVTVVLYQNSAHNKPFGHFDTPEHQTVVNGCVPFAGWALDDMEVESVKLYLNDHSALVFIGEAVFVEGARLDVAQKYPDFPYRTRAGWGYVLLSNVLEDGPHTFLARARDKQGNEVTLGKKKLIINNANAEIPFGTIDIPAWGGVVSGSGYRVHGWALAHPPDTIKSAGVIVYIDGVEPEQDIELFYGDHRPDVCSIFPGYTCDSAFHFDIDTTDYSSGTHIIHCNVTDTGSDSNSIGIRYFNIWNTSTCSDASQASSQKLYSMPDPTEIPVYYSEPVKVKKGYKPTIKPETIYPDNNGIINIKIKELERLKIRLFPGGAGKWRLESVSGYTGYLKVEEQLWPLPIGSTLDTGRGIFYWQPGPGFIGEYQLVFVEKEPNGAMNKKLISVKIVPKFKNESRSEDRWKNFSLRR